MQRIETEYTIRKKRDRQLYNITISARNRNKFNLQKKLEIFSIDQKDEIQRMEDKYSSILQKYIDKKTIDYRKKCEQEIEKLSDPVQKREKYRSPSHNNLLNKLLILLQTFVRLSDTDDKGRGLCISC